MTHIDESHTHAAAELEWLVHGVDRRRRPRPSAGPGACPHCDDPRPAAHHLRDAGAADPASAYALGYCPELARRRQRPSSHASELADDTHVVATPCA